MSSRSFRGTSGNQKTYLASFCIDVHELIRMGYQRMHYQAFSASEETDITGELVRAIHGAMQDRRAPEWMARYALPKDDPPLNTAERLGKHRFRIDIEFERVQHGQRPLFRFEAKRLDGSHDVGKYLGEDGLGCFLSGKYPLTHDEAGMLGYVQSDDEPTWAKRIEDRINGGRREYAVCTDGAWQKAPVIRGLDHTYRTRHNRKPPLSAVTIRHVLLRFC